MKVMTITPTLSGGEGEDLEIKDTALVLTEDVLKITVNRNQREVKVRLVEDENLELFGDGFTLEFSG